PNRRVRKKQWDGRNRSQCGGPRERHGCEPLLVFLGFSLEFRLLLSPGFLLPACLLPACFFLFSYLPKHPRFILLCLSATLFGSNEGQECRNQKRNEERPWL